MPRAKLRRYFRHGLLPQLTVFEAVARLGSVTRAAQELHLAQPTVSMQIKKLAATLEVKLFEQRGRSLQLTAAGRSLQESCVEALALFGRIEERLAAFRNAMPEVLRVAAEPEARAVAARLRLAAGEDDVYLFELEIEGLPAERRWVTHAKGRELARAAALFLREALLLDAYNSQPVVEEEGWSSRANTTRR
jgi:molybdenum-dependent DNA-binding transcriptional regulator ModE